MLHVLKFDAASPKANFTAAGGIALVVTHKSDFHWAGPSGITTGSRPASCTNFLLSTGHVPVGVTTLAVVV